MEEDLINRALNRKNEVLRKKLEENMVNTHGEADSLLEQYTFY